jgi:RNA recognition motif-containing protein
VGGGNAVPQGSNVRARVYIGSVSFEINSDQLRAIFEPFGTIKSCELLPPTDTTAGQPHRGYGFIEFEVCACLARVYGCVCVCVCCYW